MSNQVTLRKKGPSDATPWLEWAGWTTGKRFEWFTHIQRAGTQVEVGDNKNYSRSYPTEQKALDAMLEAIRDKIAEGYDYRPTPAAPAPAKPSKPWANKPKTPAWFTKLPKAELGKLRTAITDAGLAHRSADIESLARPAIAFTTKTVKTVKGVVSRFGGDPDLPPDHPWPKVGKTPLAFVAQYRLEELANLDLLRMLPPRGVISVFVQLASDDGYGENARVFYFPDTRTLVRTVPTHDAETDHRPSKIAVATPRLKITVPPAEHPIAATLKLRGDEADAYHDGVWLALCAVGEAGQGKGHQLLGWPDAMTAHATRSATLLAQIDSDDRAGLEMGDVETLRLHVGAKQLAAKRLGAVRCTMAAD